MDSLLAEIIGFIVAVVVFLATLRLFNIDHSLKQISGTLNQANLHELSDNLAWLKEAKAAELRRSQTPPESLVR